MAAATEGCDVLSPTGHGPPPPPLMAATSPRARSPVTTQLGAGSGGAGFKWATVTRGALDLWQVGEARQPSS